MVVSSRDTNICRQTCVVKFKHKLLPSKLQAASCYSCLAKSKDYPKLTCCSAVCCFLVFTPSCDDQLPPPTMGGGPPAGGRGHLSINYSKAGDRTNRNSASMCADSMKR